MSHFSHTISRAFSNPVQSIQAAGNTVGNAIAGAPGKATDALSSANHHLGDQAERAYNNPANFAGKALITGALMSNPVTAAGIPLLYGMGQGSGGARSIMPGSGGQDYLLGGRTNMIQRQSNAADQASADKAAADQQALVDQLFTKFGVGENADAKQNAAAIEGSKQNILNAYQQQQQAGADKSYLQGLTQAREGAASAGQLNGSADIQARNSLYQAYAGNNAAVQTGRTQAGESFDTTLDQQRKAMEDAIRNRTVTSTTGMGADIASLRNAAGSAFSNAAASAIPVAANLGSNYALANAYNGSNFNTGKPFASAFRS